MLAAITTQAVATQVLVVIQAGDNTGRRDNTGNPGAGGDNNAGGGNPGTGGDNNAGGGNPDTGGDNTVGGGKSRCWR